MERGKLFEIKIDLVTTDPRAGPRSRGDERRAAAARLPSFPTWATSRGRRRGVKEQNRISTSPTFLWTNFQNSSTILLRAKLQRTDFSRIIPPSDTRFCLLYFRPFPEFPEFRESFVRWLRSRRDRTSWEIRGILKWDQEIDPIFIYLGIETDIEFLDN